MATSYYSTGTITLTNGSAVVTGTGTAWSTALIASGNLFVQAPGNPMPILSVDSDTQITSELTWTGATGTYSYQIQLDQSLTNSAQNATNLAYLLSELRQGTLFKYDAAGTLADRSLFDARPKGYSYLVFSDEEAELYVKASNASGDWAGPYAYGTGPVGPEGPMGTLTPRGTYSGATAYEANDNVLYQGSSWVALQSTVGNAPPTLPTTENAYWSLLAVKGQDGTGIGDMLASIYDPQSLQVDAFDRGNHTGTQAITTVIGLQPILDAMKWLSRGVGELYSVFDERPGADIPPTDDSRFRYIKLTAGLTGSGQYNNGALISETTSGSSPYITATATISLVDSPLDGQVVNLLNTERRYLRSGSSGTMRDDQIKAHSHTIPAVSTTAGSGGAAGLTRNLGSAAPVASDATDSFGGEETRVREIGITHYMRIK